MTACGKQRKKRTPENPRKRWVNQSGHICKFCNREFRNGNALGGHAIRCKKNPDRVVGNGLQGRKNTPASNLKRRIAQIAHIESRTGHQMMPSYNPGSIPIIEEYGRKHGYKFQHAENGGEFHIAALGYWVDAYDAEKNVVLEYDESHHFDSEGNLRERDRQRQKEIEEHLGCEFIRIKCHSLKQ